MLEVHSETFYFILQIFDIASYIQSLKECHLYLITYLQEFHIVSKN